jgi:hypothetical protein
MPAVKSSEFQKNVGLWLDRVNEAPVEIRRYDRTAGYLVSARRYEELLASYRKAMPAYELSDDEALLLRDSKVETSARFTLDDLPDESEQ